MTSSPAESPTARLQELKALATACHTAFLAVSAASHWKPGPDATDRVDAMNRVDPSTSSDGIMAGAALVSEVVVSYLEIAAGNLKSIGTLIGGGELFGPPALARAVMENCARVFWVLGKGIDPAAVLARAYLEEFDSCERQKSAAKRLGGGTSAPEYGAARARWTSVRQRAMKAFPGATREALAEGAPGRTIGSDTLPSPAAGVIAMFEFLRADAGGTITGGVAEGMYDFLSSNVHPSLYTIRQLRRYIDHGDHYGSELHMDLNFIEKLLMAALITFYNALSYTMSFYDLARAPHDVLTEQMAATFPEAFTGS
ncbi:hypothetical protein [Rhodococcus sp. NBC_00294]|uniref:hypothetical protein n=1 Tax=Rhodococcus sp. NBC_00294 TaxID=2976004 RepID=UPI002E2DE704|nr:hypothetical protein [Rhodococcus sp. NBC_00294]